MGEREPKLDLAESAPAAEAEQPHYVGHRERLRARFLKDFGQAMPDYELVELLLTLAIPRRDVKPLAKELLAEFGGMPGLIAASGEELAAFGLKEGAITAIKIVHAAMIRSLKAEVETAHVISSWDRLIDYLKISMGREKVEQVRILFLDTKLRLIADELQQRGTVNHTPLYPREVVRRALELNASSLILVHNHPSGDTNPSREDIEMTREISDALGKIGIAVHDHVIVGRGKTSSFKSLGLL